MCDSFFVTSKSVSDDKFVAPLCLNPEICCHCFILTQQFPVFCFFSHYVQMHGQNTETVDLNAWNNNSSVRKTWWEILLNESGLKWCLTTWTWTCSHVTKIRWIGHNKVHLSFATHQMAMTQALEFKFSLNKSDSLKLMIQMRWKISVLFFWKWATIMESGWELDEKESWSAAFTRVCMYT